MEKINLTNCDYQLIYQVLKDKVIFLAIKASNSDFTTFEDYASFAGFINRQEIYIPYFQGTYSDTSENLHRLFGNIDKLKERLHLI